MKMQSVIFQIIRLLLLFLLLEMKKSACTSYVCEHLSVCAVFQSQIFYD